MQIDWERSRAESNILSYAIRKRTNMATNGAGVKETGRTNRNKKVAEKVLRYRQIFWEVDQTRLLGDALKQQSLEKWDNRLNKIKRELERLDVGDV
jgi:hypothetical protein